MNWQVCKPDALDRIANWTDQTAYIYPDGQVLFWNMRTQNWKLVSFDDDHHEITMISLEGHESGNPPFAEAEQVLAGHFPSTPTSSDPEPNHTPINGISLPRTIGPEIDPIDWANHELLFDAEVGNAPLKTAPGTGLSDAPVQPEPEPVPLETAVVLPAPEDTPAGQPDDERGPEV